MDAASGQDRNDEADAVLLKRIAGGEEAALTELYERHAPLLYTLSLRILRSAAEAEDTVQEIFLQAWNKPGGYHPADGTVFTWLVTAVRNRSLDRMRSKGPRQPLQQMDLSSLSMSGERPGPGAQPVTAALKSLSSEDRQALALAYYEGYSLQEIAARFSIPASALKSHLRKALLAIGSASGVTP